MKKTLKVRDLTLRDGQQSSFATRMTQQQIDRCLPFYKDAGFFAMEVWGGAVPDSVMRYLNENPWDRLEKIHAAVGSASKLTALSRGRNLFGYNPYTNEIIDGFCRNSIESGLGIMRIFDALNDVDNIKSTVSSVKKHGGIADCAICYTVDPKYKRPSFWEMLSGKRMPKPIFTDSYFVEKARAMASLGADMITIKDMSGLIPPQRVRSLIELIKREVSLPIDFHTHCTPGYGLASVLTAIVAGVDIVDTNCWWFAGGTGAPAVELIYTFCKKMDIELGANMEAVAKINEQLSEIRTELELSVFGSSKPRPRAYNPLTDKLPADIDAMFDEAINAARECKDSEVLRLCQHIEMYFGFPAPDELVQRAEIPGGMYSNMVAQLKQLKSENILPRAMELIPQVRMDAGLPPLVTPTSQIVGAQAVNCAIAEKAGRDLYTNKSAQFTSLVKGEYGHTPAPIDPAFRKKITGSNKETAYDTSKYTMQPNPELEEAGGVKLAQTEKELLLLELFPLVAKDFLTRNKTAAYHNAQAKAKAAERKDERPLVLEDPKEAITGFVVEAPLPGTIIDIAVQVGQMIARNDVVATLEAMKMENAITSDVAGTVKRIFVKQGDIVATTGKLVEIE